MKTKSFSRNHFMTPGRSEAQADNDALRAAIAFRKSLVRQGIIRERRPVRPGGCRGVYWESTTKQWAVRIRDSSGGKVRTIARANFKPLDDTPEEIEKARLLAVAKRRELEHKHFDVQVTGADAQQEPQSGCPGVQWHKYQKVWRARCPDGNRVMHEKTFRPKDDTPEEIENARLAAIEGLQKMREDKHMENQEKPDVDPADPIAVWREAISNIWAARLKKLNEPACKLNEPSCKLNEHAW